MTRSGLLTLEEHLKEREAAERSYAEGRDASLERQLWFTHLDDARKEVEAALAATSNLANIPEGLIASGAHSRALRFLLAPPLSQDQFMIICPKWSKTLEKKGLPLSPEAAAAFDELFAKRSDTSRVSNLSDPHNRTSAIESTAILIAANEFATARRMLLADVQQRSVSELLRQRGYQRVALGIVDEPGSLAEKTFALATQFTTADGSSHEVDVAIGLAKKAILAIECKVSNDRTNSIKRVNDVLKKASAWKRQWGNFVVTAALLQGVFSRREPRRLMDNNVEIFWSHRLESLADWLDHAESNPRTQS